MTEHQARVLICDVTGCESRLTVLDVGLNELRAEAKESGWSVGDVNDGGYDVCPQHYSAEEQQQVYAVLNFLDWASEKGNGLDRPPGSGPTEDFVRQWIKETR